MPHTPDSTSPYPATATVVKLENVEPFTPAFAQETPQRAPDILDALLFAAPPEPGDQLRCFALLDAAKLPNLPELLEQSGLEHRCLFLNDEDENLGAVAPWLVRLEPGNRFTTNLFTAEGKAGAAWHLWGRDACVFMRWSGPLEQLWQHFRRFTKVPDTQDKWLFVRFWDPQVLADYLSQSMPMTPFGEAMLCPGGHAARYVIPCGEDVWHGQVPARPVPPKTVPRLTQRDKDMLSVTIRATYRDALRARVTQQAGNAGYQFSDAQLDHSCDKTAKFIHLRAGLESASVQDGASLCLVLLLMGHEAGDAVLRGPVLNNPHISMSERIDMTAKSFVTALKRGNGAGPL